LFAGLRTGHFRSHGFAAARKTSSIGHHPAASSDRDLYQCGIFQMRPGILVLSF
jgi:hypothetical protein